MFQLFLKGSQEIADVLFCLLSLDFELTYVHLEMNLASSLLRPSGIGVIIGHLLRLEIQ